ncbi:hypothetical protein PENTCL1PPCAC_19488, partial [Pristionchus entomophagus]
EGYFWVHAANAAVHHVGYVTENRAKGYALNPPYEMFHNETKSGWKDILRECLKNKCTPHDLFEQRGIDMGNNKFRVGDRVETIHGEESSVLCPAFIKQVLGRRVLLEYSRHDMEKADLVKGQDLWRDMNDDLIY